MAHIIFGRRSAFKPAAGAQINYSHPLAQGLVFFVAYNLGGGQPKDLVRGIGGTLNGGAAWRSNTDGAAMDLPSASASYNEFTGLPDDDLISGGITLAWRGIAPSSPSPHFMGKHAGAGGTANPFDFRASGATPTLVRANTAFRTHTAASGFTANLLNTIAVSAPNAIETSPSFYINGRAVGSTASGTGTGAATGSSASVRVGRRADNGVQINGSANLVAIWSRQLSAAEHQLLAFDPWALLVAPKRYVSVGGSIPAGALLPGVIASTVTVHTPGITLGSGVLYPEVIAPATTLHTPQMSVYQIVSPPIIGPGTIFPSSPIITFPASAQVLYPSGIGGNSLAHSPTIGGPLQYLVPLDISGGGSIWAPAVVRSNEEVELKVFVAGRRQRVKVGTYKSSMQLNGRSTAGFTIYCPPGATVRRPKPLMTVRVTEYGRTEFIGLIETVTQKVINPGVPLADYGYEWACTCVDWSNILDHRIVSGTFTGSAKAEVRRLISEYAPSDNITFNHVTTTATITEDVEVKQQPLSQVLNRIAEITGDVWFIDPDRDLHFHSPSDGPVAPIVVGSLSGNVRNVEVTETSIGFSNATILRTEEHLGEED